MKFVGRSASLRQLDVWIERIGRERAGIMVAVRGRRQVGKSRLYTEWLRRTGVAHVFFSAVHNAPEARQLEEFRRGVLESSAPLAEVPTLFSSPLSSWSDAFARLRLAIGDTPAVLVLDEFPWAVASSTTLEGELQNAWDRTLRELPVLVALIGSDVAMMERITAHDRPLYGRASEQRLEAFNPAEVNAALGGDLDPFEAFDAYLVTGGYPRLVEDLARHGDVRRFVRASTEEDLSDLAVVAQRSLDAEFPAEAQARRVLSAIGADEIGSATFSSAVGAFPELSTKSAETAVVRALQLLVSTKRLVALDVPAGDAPNSRLRRYRVDDPYLRFWFQFIEPELANIARGRGDLAMTRFDKGFSAWRGRAIEPIIREAIRRRPSSLDQIGDDARSVETVGAWWNRTNSVEVDLVLRDARRVVALGSIKWRARKSFSAAEGRVLAAARSVVPDAGGARLFAVCPGGVNPSSAMEATLDARDLLAAWEA